MLTLLISLLLLSPAQAEKPLPHAEAGRVIAQALAQGPEQAKRPDANARAAFALVHREARAEITDAKTRARKGPLGKKRKAEDVLELARLEVGADLKVIEYHLRSNEKLANEDVYDAMKALAKKDLLNDTPAPSLDWDRSLATAARVQALLLEKIGVKP